MSIADELRRDADAALKEDGMYYSGEYLDGIAKRVEMLADENAKLRELVSVVYGYYASGTISPCDLCDAIGCQYVGEAEFGCRYHDHFDSAEAADDEIQRRMRELGIEVE